MSKMHQRKILFLHVLLILIPMLTNAAITVTQSTNAGSIFFPEQLEYFRLAEKCFQKDMVLWLGDGRCYPEGQQGPCNIGRVLILDRRIWEVRCQTVMQQ